MLDYSNDPYFYELSNESGQENSDFANMNDFQLMDELCSQTSQFKDSSFSKEIDIIENISKVFTFSGTKNENSSSTECGFLQSFSDSDTERIYIKNNSEQKNEIKEQKPQTEVNEEISKESNLNIDKEETPSQLNPLNEDKNDKNNAKADPFTSIFKILKNYIKYLDDRIERIKKEAITEKDIESTSLFTIKNKKIKKDKVCINKNEEKENKENKENKEKKFGRKAKGVDNTSANHKKDCPDNIIKKIKAFYFSCVTEYVQNFINIHKKNKDTKQINLLTLDYKYVNRLEKKENLEFLKKPLKEIISLDTSKKYKNKKTNTNWNERIVVGVLEKEKDNEVINSLLNMKFSTWIDVFTYRQKWKYNLQSDKIKYYFEEIQDKYDDEYFSKFLFYFFNYQNWFLHKKGRVQKKE